MLLRAVHQDREMAAALGVNPRRVDWLVFLLGTALAALLVGLFSAGFQMFTSVSVADVLLLVMVVVFIQFRPRGMVARRSRALEEG